jgi:hypothetical protein
MTFSNMKRLDGSASRKNSWWPGTTILYRCGQFTEPIIAVSDCLHALGEHGEIASVDEDVAVRHIHLAMQLMRVDEEDKAKSGLSRRRSACIQVPFHARISGAGRVWGTSANSLSPNIQ